MTDNPNDRPLVPAEDQNTTPPAAEVPSPDVDPAETAPPAGPPRRKILIGSQRDPDAYRPKPKRDWTPVKEPDDQAETPPVTAPEAPPSPKISETPETPEATQAPIEVPTDDSPRQSFPPPNIRGQLSPELETEFEEALDGVEMEDLIADGEAVTKQEMLDPDAKQKGRIVMIRRDNAFVELGGREQGIVSLQQFPEPPEVGQEVDVIVVRYNLEDGLYELRMPMGAAQVEDWSDLEEGMIVDARVVGHNSGGLECEINHIRGFIPISQVSLFRVEDLEEFVGEKFRCLVSEVNPRRGNLVLSRRAVLEREREEAKQKMLESLEPGQTFEGTVRKLMDFGAFVDLGSGVDGLLHISQISWGRIQHPREILSEGQQIKVKIIKYDAQTGRIGLAYRDMLPDPWHDVEMKFPPGSQIKGTVVKIMDFGAFVELEPGIEGLVHVSELSHKRVWRPTDVVKEGEEVEVMVKSVDPHTRRVGLSMKDLIEPPQDEKKTKQGEEPGQPAQKSKQRASNEPLKGGLGQSTGSQFGLKW